MTLKIERLEYSPVNKGKRTDLVGVEKDTNGNDGVSRNADKKPKQLSRRRRLARASNVLGLY